jgi:hypothetical protein
MPVKMRSPERNPKGKREEVRNLSYLVYLPVEAAAAVGTCCFGSSARFSLYLNQNTWYVQKEQVKNV